MSTFEQATKCPNCGYNSQSTTSTLDKSPEPKSGDFFICLNCGLPCVFNDNLNLIEADLDKMNLSPQDKFTIDEIIASHKDMKRQGLLDLNKNKTE